tara:strand:- start:41 stop:859 length:819 start_codon:yes stop_codon:yes gene_type:complete
MILQKIQKNLFIPHKLPFKIIKKINFYYNLKKYNKKIFEIEQDNIFKKIGLDRKKGIEKLKNILKEINLPLKKGMTSEHENLFSSISLNDKLNINNILEIGTFDGNNALLLSKIFPKSTIDTIDLNHDENDFKNYYARKDSINNFIKERNKIISSNKKINFFEMNSLNLINHKKKYDLIWIDGAHGYPIVCIDIINSLNLINNNGLILCDDVYLTRKHSHSDKMYASIATYETINELKKENIIKFNLIYKRLSAKNNSIISERKFIAILRKI